MVMASGRWLGVRLDLLTSVFIGAVSVAAVLGSQDTGRYIMYICKVNQNLPPPKKKKKNDVKSEENTQDCYYGLN